MKNDINDIIELIDSSGNKWVKNNLILLVRSGSHAYGTNTEKSDRDFKGICIPPVDYHLGLKDFKSMNLSSGDQAEKNTKEDIDLTIYSLKEFIKLASKGNPNVLEIIFVDEEDIIYMTAEGQQLGLNRDLFLSNQLEKSFGGYAMSSMKYLDRALGIEEPTANKKIQNGVRIYESAIEIFKTGTMKTKRPNPNYLKELRNGSCNVVQGKHLLTEKEKEFREARKNSVLGDKIDSESINELLISLTMNFLGLMTKEDYMSI